MSLRKLTNELAEAYHLESLWLFKKKNILTLDLISVRPEMRGRGCGKAAMEELVAWADEQRLTMVLTPSPLYGSDEKRLIKWYESLGFVRQGLEMMRTPKRG